MKSVEDGGKRSVPSAWMTVCSGILTSGSRVHTLFSLSVNVLAFYDINIGCLSFNGELSDLSVGSRDSTSVAWCLLPARCTTSKSYSNRQSHHRAGLPGATSRFRVQLREP